MDAPDVLTRDEAADAIARWWSQWLQTIAPMDNGDRSDHGIASRGLAEMLTRERLLALPAGAPDRFEVALRERVAAALDAGLRGLPVVDYDPCGMLLDAAEVAGFDPRYLFPVKSRTFVARVDGGFLVSVRCGRGADRVALSRPVPPTT
jgi:hypothetical protein